MVTEKEILQEELRSLLASPAIGVPEYAADPMIGRRVGRMLADAQMRNHASPSARHPEAAFALNPQHFKVI